MTTEGEKLERLQELTAQVALLPEKPGVYMMRDAAGKIIRFSADDIPAKEGVVQGVNCMSLRADSSVAATVTDAGVAVVEEP